MRVGLTNMGSTPLRATAVEEALRGQPLDAERIARGGRAGRRGHLAAAPTSTRPPDYKRHLARVLCRRALEEAAGVS